MRDRYSPTLISSAHKQLIIDLFAREFLEVSNFELTVREKSEQKGAELFSGSVRFWTAVNIRRL
jgi:hypothetical protein